MLIVVPVFTGAVCITGVRGIGAVGNFRRAVVAPAVVAPGVIRIARAGVAVCEEAEKIHDAYAHTKHRKGDIEDKQGIHAGSIARYRRYGNRFVHNG